MKTNRRDAVNLAHYHRSGNLTTVFIPDEATEAIRDLCRARCAAKRAERVARQQLSKFLLRQGRRFTRSTWGKAHRAWIAQQHFERPVQQSVLEDHVAVVDLASDRVQRLAQKLADSVPTWSSLIALPIIIPIIASPGCWFKTPRTCLPCPRSVPMRPTSRRAP